MVKRLNKNAATIVICALIIAVLIAGNVICGLNARIITIALGGTGVTFEGEKVESAQKLGDELCRSIADESVVLLKNELSTLPLPLYEKKISVFGWASSDGGFILGGGGSGTPTVHDDKKVTLLSALQREGFEYCRELAEFYDNYGEPRKNNFVLTEPPVSRYTSALMKTARDFSDTALVVIARYGGENIGEIPDYQLKSDGSRDDTRTYLQSSAEEDALLKIVCENFDKVVVLLNTCNTMHSGFLENDKIDAALYVGVTGQSGALAIPKILKGELNPSGKLSDTYIFAPESDPTWHNRNRRGDHIQYVEDIYFGYRWYETAAADGYFDDVSNRFGNGYDGVVQYAFGYGLSYTDFDWEISGISVPPGGSLKQNDKIEITVSVTNTGTMSGKDVVQVYYSPPYYKNGIEKAEIYLAGFAKTALLKPGQTQQGIKISFNVRDMAAYDCYDRNKNGVTAYELDGGVYKVKLMKDAHTPASCANSEIVYHVENTIVYSNDPITAHPVKNRFTGADAYSGVPIDGSTVGAEAEYLSRLNFADTFPDKAAKRPTNTALIDHANRFVNDDYAYDGMPVTSAENNLRLVTREDGASADIGELNKGENLKYNAALMFTLGADYEHPQWKSLLDQMTIDEMCNLVEYGGFRTQAVASIGKPYCNDFDGPAGFNENSQSPVIRGEWTAYPSEALMGCSWNTEIAYQFGLALGVEANATGINGIYAPCVNLHRSAYNARNFEFFGEDGVLSGKLAAGIIRGAKRNGLYCYVKHFALGETGQNAFNLNTWAMESNLRENYLKPFEIAVKEGGANAVMSSYNRVGGTWAGASYPLNVSILREEWGFRGSVITDYTVGERYMSIEQGIRAGNDLWLNPNDTSGQTLDRDDPVSVNRARIAVKNILYTFTNTYYYALNNDDEADRKYDVVLGVFALKTVFPWWIIVLVFIDVTVAAALVYTLWKTFAPKRKQI